MPFWLVLVGLGDCSSMFWLVLIAGVLVVLHVLLVLLDDVLWCLWVGGSSLGLLDCA